MHAYLIVGADSQKRKEKATDLAKSLKAKILEFPLAKIDDARQLKAFASLKVTSPTAVYIDSIENATDEALNAFLKNLEEPQKDLFYILTAASPAKILPTIISRCEIIKLIHNSKSGNDDKDTLPILPIIDKIKDREEAKEFVRNLIKQMHFDLLNNEGNHNKVAKNLEIAIQTLNNLEANGNVNLQLTNMVINFK